MTRFVFSLFLTLTLISCTTPSGGTKKSSGPLTDRYLDRHSASENEHELPHPVKKLTLSNGLTVIMVSNPKLPIFSYYTFYKVGSKNERPGITGASHYLEHMMFKGTKTYGPGVFDKLIESFGGESNAYTTADQTVYHEDMPLRSLDDVIALESDRMQNLALEGGAFERERYVIQEEKKMRYENRPSGFLRLTTIEKSFVGTPYAIPTIGTDEDLKKITRDDVMKYYQQFYAPNNAVVVIVGDIDFDQLTRKIEKAYERLQASTGMAETQKEATRPEKFKVAPVSKKEFKFYGLSPNPLFIMAFSKGEKVGTRRELALSMLTSTLSGGDSSYFNQKFVQGEKGLKPLLSAVSFGNYGLREAGLLMITGELLRGVTMDQVKQRFATLFKDLCSEKGPIQERTLEKSRNQVLVALYRQMDTNSGIAELLGQGESSFQDYNFYADELKTYSNLTLGEVRKECQNIFESPAYDLYMIWDKFPRTPSK